MTACSTPLKKAVDSEQDPYVRVCAERMKGESHTCSATAWRSDDGKPQETVFYGLRIVPSQRLLCVRTLPADEAAAPETMKLLTPLEMHKIFDTAKLGNETYPCAIKRCKTKDSCKFTGDAAAISELKAGDQTLEILESMAKDSGEE
jgi:hypothetical protein